MTMTVAYRHGVERDISFLRGILRDRPAYIHVGPGDYTITMIPVEHLLEAYDELLEAVRILDRNLEVQAAVQPTSQKVLDAWATIRDILPPKGV